MCVSVERASVGMYSSRLDDDGLGCQDAGGITSSTEGSAALKCGSLGTNGSLSS